MKQNINFSFQLKNKLKNEPTPTVTVVEQDQDEKLDVNGKSEMSPPTISDSCEQTIEASDPKSIRPFLRPSPSETSLTRSRSLEFPALPKHAPDCKDNPYKL